MGCGCSRQHTAPRFDRFSLRSSLILALVVGPLAAFIAGRLRVLSLSYYNAPGRMPLHANFSSFDIKFQDRIRSCEDVMLVEARRLALLACDPGREGWNTVMGNFFDEFEPDPNAELYAYHYDKSDADALVPIKVVGFDGELRTIGFDFHAPSATLFVTNHPREGGPHIEQFHLDLDTLTATHRHTLSHPLVNIPNSIAAKSGTEFYVTNQHHFVVADNRLLWFLETYLAPPLATVVHARVLPSGELDAKIVARQAYPNGVALFGNESMLAVASTNKRKVNLYAVTNPVSGSETVHPSLRLTNSIDNLPYLPDNVAVSADGALLIAGHPHLPSLNAFAISRFLCNRPEHLAEAGEEGAQFCESSGQAASWASEWTPETGVRHIYSGWEYPTSATVVRDREQKIGIVAGLYAKGIMVWRD
ncbi:Serum paraoxonase/arylesterase [Paramyrothecium foliicola]|nr:Serum paraoxonase/arylesterase [Paramyrothecium foliicola]